MKVSRFLKRWRRSAFALLLAPPAIALAALEARAATPVPTPTVTSAATGNGVPWRSTTQDIASFGYVQNEFLLEGTARSYVATVNLASVTNGQWDAAPTGPTAPYKVRILIERPKNAARFNGTVLVEWLNVSAGMDSGTFDSFRDWFMREGYAYVGVSAQAVGVNHLQKWDAGRYGSLTHPGDSYSYDIFSQAARALRVGDPAPLGDLTGRVKSLVAWGGSQSGGRLFTYANAIHHDARVIDGIVPFVTSRGSPLTQDPLPAVPTPTGAAAVLRTDLQTPILFQVSEAEAIASARGVHTQSDATHLRVWEHAGMSHASRSSTTQMATGAPQAPGGSGVQCSGPPLNGLNAAPVWRAMINAMHVWTQQGKAPASAPRIELAIPDDSTKPATPVRDSATGLAKGGIRLPQVAAPVATRWGSRPQGLQEGPGCGAYGTSDPWNGDSDAWDRDPSLNISPIPEPSLLALYKNDEGYRKAIDVSARQLVAKGWLLPDDAKAIAQEAKDIQIR